MEHLTVLGSLALMHLLGAMLPGPNTVVVRFYGAILIIVLVQASAWYAFVALALSTRLARRCYRRIRRALEGLAGAVMIAFGLKLAIEARGALAR